MRELTLNEFNLVSGGIDMSGYKPPASAYAINALRYVAPIARAFSVGYSIGTAINKYTPIQSGISKVIDKITDGNNYCNDGGNY